MDILVLKMFYVVQKLRTLLKVYDCLILHSQTVSDKIRTLEDHGRIFCGKC